MFGIEDKYVAVVYLLCIANSLLCIVYGLANWNRGEEAVKDEDIRWAQEERHVEEEL